MVDSQIYTIHYCRELLRRHDLRPSVVPVLNHTNVCVYRHKM